MTTMNANAFDTVDWSEVDEGMARQIFEQGQTFLQAQLQVALAADQRATAIAGLFATVGTAAIGGAFAYWDKEADSAILVAGVLTGVGMIAGALRALWAARPVPFNTAGNYPNKWYECRTEPLALMLGAEAENYQACITENEAILKANGAAIRQGATLAVASPLAGTLAWFLLRFIASS